ncbi:hypothetical protein B0J11DRAFT_448508 [Dendryphion nanum]|uniref:Uncharacterized protein n=1 Tax=Dendryphion nanum TaxID=256645 RepID=A0A9P9D0B9_9PLEO|nr:hypothetical protein B0J11DRAFT_448508 [Dendryphion nanum]
MLGVGTDQTPSEGHLSTLPDRVSDPHTNGHLVSTGFYIDNKVQQLAIHVSLKATTNHNCHSYLYNVDNQGIDEVFSKRSADFTIKEHGWFRNVAIFRQICAKHPVPNGKSPQEIFTNWQHSLLDYLDTNHSGGLWTRID